MSFGSEAGCILDVILAVTITLSAAPVLFEKDIRPIFKTHCFQCHGEDGKEKGDLDVRLKRLLLKGGAHGPSIVAGQPDKSLLFQKVRDGKMANIKIKFTGTDKAEGLARIGDNLTKLIPTI